MLEIIIQAAANAVAPAAPPQPPTLWSAAVLAAVIGAGSALATTFVKEWLLERLKERRATRRSDGEVYARYLAPLSEACEKLVWRTREIFVARRHAFLKTSTLPLEFNEYKRVSTLYRIASLIGWVRGMNLELSALAAHNPGYSPPIAAQISAFSSALAEGPSVEQDRLRRLCALWSLDLNGVDATRLTNLAMRFEVKAHAAFGIEQADLRSAQGLSRAAKRRACHALADFLADELKGPPPSRAALDASLEEAASSLAYREALIYREWQDAIGDAMIVRDADSPRRFRIIGFEAFTKLVVEPETPWLRVFASSLDDIDFENPDPRDFRAQQLRKIANAAAAMLVAINDTGNPSPVNEASLKAASEILAAS